MPSSRRYAPGASSNLVCRLCCQPLLPVPALVCICYLTVGGEGARHNLRKLVGTAGCAGRGCGEKIHSKMILSLCCIAPAASLFIANEVDETRTLARCAVRFFGGLVRISYTAGRRYMPSCQLLPRGSGESAAACLVRQGARVGNPLRSPCGHLRNGGLLDLQAAFNAQTFLGANHDAR
jgi:hypothetical protein